MFAYTPAVNRLALVIVLASSLSACADPAPPIVVPNPGMVSFGDVYVGTTAPAPGPVAWRNVGGSAATVTGLTLGGPNAAVFGMAPATPFANSPAVASGQVTSAVTFSFTPSGEGTFAGAGSLALGNGRGTPVPVALVGNGRYQIQVGDLVFLGGGNLQPGRWLDFRRVQVGTPPPGRTRRFQVTNFGNAMVRVTEIVFTTGGQGFSLRAPPPPFVLNSQQSRMIDIDFDPPAFTRPPNQKRFTDAVTVKGETVGAPAQRHSYGTSLCGVGFYPAEEPELKC